TRFSRDWSSDVCSSDLYQLGLGISSQFLNGAAWGAHQSGALCLQISSEASGGFVTTGLLKTFLPSLGTLTERDGRDAPMLIVLRSEERRVGKEGRSRWT